MKIIWAVDAFENNKELNQKMADYIQHLYGKFHPEIEPVYLHREDEMVLPTYEGIIASTDSMATGESLLGDLLAECPLSFLQKPKVIPHTATSQAGAAEILADYADASYADLILVGSHGRQGLQRWVWGSFAESLLRSSQVPVCVLGAHATKTNSTQRILFPTDFGEHSQANFQHALELGQRWQAEILLLHAATRFSSYNQLEKMQSLGQRIAAQLEKLSEKAQKWVTHAQQRGVHVEHILDMSFRPVDDLIIQTAAENACDLIFMEAQSSALTAALLGSYTHNVVRRSDCPVYVLPRAFYPERFPNPRSFRGLQTDLGASI